MLCPDHPVTDIAFLLCTSLPPENLNNWTDDLIENYVKTFQEMCFMLKIKMPFDLQEFKDLFYNNGVMLVFMDLTFFWMSSPDMMKMISGDRIHYKSRYLWTLKNCIKTTPEVSEFD